MRDSQSAPSEGRSAGWAGPRLIDWFVPADSESMRQQQARLFWANLALTLIGTGVATYFSLPLIFRE